LLSQRARVESRLMYFVPVSKEEAGRSAEVFPVAAGAGADLALVLGAHR
jgi:hypothetical protein